MGVFYEDSTLVDDARIVRGPYLALQERDSSNATTREYAWGLNFGGGIGGLLNLRQNASDLYYLFDGKGNVSSLLDSTQTQVAQYKYDAFGRLMQSSGAVDQPFQFSTKRYDAATGLSYYGFRFYAPAIERWMNRDPLGEAGGINLYGFARGNPVNFVDPTGEYWTPLAIAGLAVTIYFAYDAWKDFIDEVEKQRKITEDYFDDPTNSEKYCAMQEAPVRALNKGVRAALSTPGTSLTGPLPTSRLDLVQSGVNSIISNEALKTTPR